MLDRIDTLPDQLWFALVAALVISSWSLSWSR